MLVLIHCIIHRKEVRKKPDSLRVMFRWKEKIRNRCLLLRVYYNQWIALFIGEKTVLRFIQDNRKALHQQKMEVIFDSEKSIQRDDSLNDGYGVEKHNHQEHPLPPIPTLSYSERV